MSASRIAYAETVWLTGNRSRPVRHRGRERKPFWRHTWPSDGRTSHIAFSEPAHSKRAPEPGQGSKPVPARGPVPGSKPVPGPARGSKRVPGPERGSKPARVREPGNMREQVHSHDPS